MSGRLIGCDNDRGYKKLDTNMDTEIAIPLGQIPDFRNCGVTTKRLHSKKATCKKAPTKRHPLVVKTTHNILEIFFPFEYVK